MLHLRFSTFSCWRVAMSGRYGDMAELIYIFVVAFFVIHGVCLCFVAIFQFPLSHAQRITFLFSPLWRQKRAFLLLFLRPRCTIEGVLISTPHPPTRFRVMFCFPRLLFHICDT